MSLDMSISWRSKQPKQKRCDRCELYYSEFLDKCTHCSDLNETQLLMLKAKHQESLKLNAKFGKYLIIAAVVIGVLLFVSFLW